MAHFAELDENNIVKRVVVVGNDIPANGGILENNDMHVDGETWCTNFFKGGTWKQTSYNSNFRKNFAGIGMRYDSVADAFYHPDKPYNSWTLNQTTFQWEAPQTRPDATQSLDKEVSWNEEDLCWEGKQVVPPPTDDVWNIYRFDSNNGTWTKIATQDVEGVRTPI